MNSRELVSALLSRAGIPASDDELAILADWYPAAHAAAAGLYGVDVGTGIPASMPNPAPLGPAEAERGEPNSVS
jgi:hypothetical protein